MDTLNTKILDSLSNHIAVLDNDGVIIYTNKPWDSYYDENKTGLINEKSGVGVNYLKLCLKHSKTNKETLRTYDGIKSVINGESDFFNNSFLVNEDRWYMNKVIPLNDNGEERKVVIIFEDITEQVLAEKEIERAKHELMNIVEYANIGIVYANSERKVISVNKKFLNMLGYKKEEELIGKTFMSFTHPDDVEKNLAEVVKVENREFNTFGMEKRYIRKDKSIVWVNLNVSIIEDKVTGTVTNFVGMVRDITEKKLGEEKLKESEDRFKLAASSANIGVWDWDVKNNVLVWDDSMYDLFEVKKEDFSGAYDAWEKTLYVYDVVPANKEVELALSGKKKFDTVFRIVTDKGDIKYIQARAKVDFDCDGNAVRMIGVNIDVTGKELMEQEKHNAIIKTEEAERQRIAHDLHDGLGQRIAAANMWIDTLDDLVRNQLDEETLSIFKAGKKLINDATKETRLVSHNIMPRSLKEYGLEQTVKELVNNIQKINENISIKLSSNLKGMRFDEVKELSIFRMIQELINNALKHSKANKINVILNEDDNLLFVDVNDNGQGFNVDEAMSKNTKGIGILSLSQRINMIGGKLNIKSKPSEGTKINIVIYLEEPAAVLRK